MPTKTKARRTFSLEEMKLLVTPKLSTADMRTIAELLGLESFSMAKVCAAIEEILLASNSRLGERIGELLPANRLAGLKRALKSAYVLANYLSHATFDATSPIAGPHDAKNDFEVLLRARRIENDSSRMAAVRQANWSAPDVHIHFSTILTIWIAESEKNCEQLEKQIDEYKNSVKRGQATHLAGSDGGARKRNIRKSLAATRDALKKFYEETAKYPDTAGSKKFVSICVAAAAQPISGADLATYLEDLIRGYQVPA